MKAVFIMLRGRLQRYSAAIPRIAGAVSRRFGSRAMQGMNEAEAKRAVEAYINTFAFVKPGGLGDLGALTPLQIEHLMQELAWRALG